MECSNCKKEIRSHDSHFQHEDYYFCVNCIRSPSSIASGKWAYDIENKMRSKYINQFGNEF